MADVQVIEVEKVGANASPGLSRQIEDPWAKLSVTDDILRPPYDPNMLLSFVDKSEVLPQCIDAMSVNVDGYGFTLDPAWNPETDQDVPQEAVVEARWLRRFFEYIHPEHSFVEIRKMTRHDIETIGYGFWEIVRNGKGEVAGVNHIPAQTMRLCKLDSKPIDCTLKVWDPEGNEWHTMSYQKRMRRFAQVVGHEVVYFKEFGDPRQLNARTGEYKGEEETDEDWVEATEVLYRRQYHPGTPYGVPRWVGQILAIAGSRAAAEVNYSYFDSKAIPPLMLMVSGGKLSENAVRRITRYLENLKGRENYHSVLVVEAEGSDASNPLGPQAENKTKIEAKDLGGALLKDGVFMEYDRDNRKKVLSAFRLPPLYVGASDDYNKATSEEAHSVAEQQVFGPERDDFDFMINRRIFPALGVRYWRFRSLAPVLDEPEKASRIAVELAKEGLTVREFRQLAEGVLNIELHDPADAEWLDYPMAVYLAMLGGGRTLAAGEEAGKERTGTVPEEVAKAVSGLVELRKMVEAAIHAEDGSGAA